MPPMKDLSAQTKFYISISTAAVVLGSAAGAVWKVQQTLTDIRDGVSDVARKVSSLEQATDGRFLELEKSYKSSISEWALRAQMANPTIKIPDPRDPSKFLYNSN